MKYIIYIVKFYTSTNKETINMPNIPQKKGYSTPKQYTALRIYEAYRMDVGICQNIYIYLPHIIME